MKKLYILLLTFPLLAQIDPNNRTRYSARGIGATSGSRIVNVLGTCPSSGCTIDSGGEESSPVVSSDIFFGVVKPVTWKLSSATWSFTADVTIPINVTMELAAGTVIDHGAHALTINGRIIAACTVVFVGGGTVTISRVTNPLTCDAWSATPPEPLYINAPTWVTGGSTAGNSRLLGFLAIGGTTVNDSTATGYVVTKIDSTFLNPDNEVRGYSATLHNTRTTPDNPTGWDFRPVTGAVQIDATNTQTINGPMIPIASETYLKKPNAGTYTVEFAKGITTSLEVGQNTTLQNWWATVLGQPVCLGGVGCTINTTAFGLYIENMQATGIDYTGADVAAIRLGGFDNYGRIEWTGSAISNHSASGTYLVIGSTNGVWIAPGTTIRDVAGNYYGLTAGSLVAQTGNITTVAGNIATAAGNFNVSAGAGASGGFFFENTQIVKWQGTGANATFLGSLTVSGGTAGRCAQFNGSTALLEAASAACGLGTVTGSGTTGTIPKWSSSTGLTDSILTDNGAGAVVLTGTNYLDSGGGYYVGGTQIVTGVRSVSNVVDITAAGNIASSTLDVKTATDHHWKIVDGAGAVRMMSTTDAGAMADGYIDASTLILGYNNGGTAGKVAIAGVTALQTLSVWGNIGISGTEVIDSSRNITGAGTIAATSFGVDSSGHLYTKGTAPSVSFCGGSPSVTGDDNTGTIAVGTGSPTFCRLTFANNWQVVPVCTISINFASGTAGGWVDQATSAYIDFRFPVNVTYVQYHCSQHI